MRDRWRLSSLIQKTGSMLQLPLQNGFKRWLNSQTAGFCDDREAPKEFHDPPSRVVTRFVFTALLCLVSLLSVLVLLFAQKPSFRTVRYWEPSYALRQFSPFVFSPNSSDDSAYRTAAASSICPCANTAFSWTRYVQFYTISLSQELQRPVRTSTITNGSDFCTHIVRNFPLNTSYISLLGCPNLLNSIVSSSDERTIIGSVSLMDPLLLNNTVRRYMQSNLDKALNDCVFVMSRATSWDVAEPFAWLRSIYELLSRMLQQFGSDPHSSDLDFWIADNSTFASSQIRLIQVIDNTTAVGLQVNWTEYVRGCSPIYCDVVKETSLGSRFFSILAQIGGFGALMLLIIRKFLWPMIVLVCGWDT